MCGPHHCRAVGDTGMDGMTLSCAPDAPGLSAQQAAPSPLTTSPFPAPSESLCVLGDTEVMVCLCLLITITRIRRKLFLKVSPGVGLVSGHKTDIFLWAARRSEQGQSLHFLCSSSRAPPLLRGHTPFQHEVLKGHWPFRSRFKSWLYHF